MLSEEKSIKTAVITGAGRRLGLHLVTRLLEDGWRVTALSRTINPELQALQTQHVSMECADLKVIEYDPLSKAGVSAAIGAVKQCCTRVDLLVHNASVFEKDEQHSEDLCDYFQTLFAVHMQLPMLLNEGFWPLMKGLPDGQATRSIVHMTDIYVENPNADYSLYCSTKAGLENLSKSYAKKFAPYVRVNSIQPGPLKFLPEHAEMDKKQVLQRTLLPFEAGFEPIYHTIQFLMNNHFVTGAHYKVDGGRAIA